MTDECVPGARVRVRFAGKDRSGFVVERTADAEHVGKLSPVRRVVSAEAVLTPQVARLCRAVADRYAGTMSDVVRLAVPPRHAAAEQALDRAEAAGRAGAPPGEVATPHTAWDRYPAGSALLHRLADGQAPYASWLAAPSVDAGQDWPVALAQLAAATRAAGRGALLVMPDQRDTDRVAAALTELLGADHFVRLTASQGPQARYTSWLKVLRGQVRCVVGTRAAAFAPVHDLGLVAWWDDGDDLLAEPRAPYPHVREVLRLRAEQEDAALLVGGFSRSVHVQQWLEQGLVRAVEAVVDRSELPRVVVAGDEWEVERSGPAAHARLPSSAWQAAHAALARGPVLVQVPRRGYLPSLRCQSCRAPARCPQCQGPLQQPQAGEAPTCRWCSSALTRFVCAECGGGRLRSGTVGARRTAEELGRAFPGVPVVRSGGGEVVAEVGSDPALVIATPGAEPLAEDGYAATLLLDGWALLDRPTLDAGEETLRRWMAAGALTRPAGRDGVVVVCSVDSRAPQPVVQSLVRWAPGWYAERELAERRELRLPPTSWMTLLTGQEADVRLMADAVHSSVERIGPLVVSGRRPGEDSSSRMLLRASWSEADQLTRELVAARAARSARKDPGSVQVRVDPEGTML
ncbi:primosome assembly protein PriA [Leekyejoonella antrihumi]|uniref:Probable replication restart protein PriA n=2 Tax=Leekyejoonella antrihumi TaxID=1660198 RepID=A0A563DX82_9MICO|nr:primosome assembly protein PriA [Leekyejoonella antrihumi]